MSQIHLYFFGGCKKLGAVYLLGEILEKGHGGVERENIHTSALLILKILYVCTTPGIAVPP